MFPESLPVETARRHAHEVALEVAAGGPEDGPLVILLHGFPDLWQGWHLQIPILVEAGFRLLLPNQRGYGESDKPGEIGAYDLDVLADDITALADSEGRSTFRVVGHDWGGIVAWWVAARFPDRVKSLTVLNAPHPGVFKPYALRRPIQLLRSSYMAFFQLPWLPEAMLSAGNFALLYWMVRATSRSGTFDETDRRYLVQGWSQPGALRSMLNYYRAAARRRTHSLQRRIPQPTLILFGRNDPAEESGLARASEAYCDNSRRVEFEAAHHWPHREEPERVNAELLSFLTSPDTTRS